MTVQVCAPRRSLLWPINHPNAIFSLADVASRPQTLMHLYTFRRPRISFPPDEGLDSRVAQLDERNPITSTYTVRLFRYKCTRALCGCLFAKGWFVSFGEKHLRMVDAPGEYYQRRFHLVVIQSQMFHLK